MKLILAILITIASFSCTTTKEVATTETTNKVDSSAIREVIRLRKDSITMVERHKEEIKAAKNTGVTFTPLPCPTISIDSACSRDSMVKVIRQLEDRLNKSQNKVRILADGSIEAEGNLDAAYSNAESLRTYNHELELRVSELQLDSDSSAVNVSRLEEENTRLKNVKRGFPWLWFLVGCAIGGVVAHLITRWMRPLK